jgi:hypothetical protein
MKLLTVLVVLFALSISFAQSNQGRITLSGSIGFESSTEKTDPASSEITFTSITLMPEFGYYISDAIKIGLGIGYNATTNENKPLAGNTAKWETNMLIINPFARFYVQASDRVDLFLQANLAYGTGGYEQSPSINKGDITSLNIFLTPGIEFMISQKIALDFSIGRIGYFSTTVTPDGTPKVEMLTNSFNFNFNLTDVHLGINIFIN